MGMSSDTLGPAVSQPNTAAGCVEQGEVMTGHGDFDAAAALYRRAIEIDRTHLPAYFNLSALQWSTDRADEARATLEQGLHAKPFMHRACYGKAEATILELKGVESSYFMLGDALNRKLRGGNFTTKFLIDRNRFTKLTFYVTGDNLLTYRGLPKFDIVVNSIADADREGRSLATAAAFLDTKSKKPVINRPERVLPTTRDGNAARLNDVDGVAFPKTTRLSTADQSPQDVMDVLDRRGFLLPILVREPGSQTGRTFEMVKTPKALFDYVAAMDGDALYAIQYIDERMRGKTLFSRSFKYFRKMRVFFIDGRLYPVVCHIDRIWNVHGDNRKDVMLQHKWMMEEEVRFASDCKGYLGADAYQALHAIHGVIGLDFFGIDFTLRPDGSILVYELNPAMRHSYKHARNFPYLQPSLEAITQAFNRMILDRLGR